MAATSIIPLSGFGRITTTTTKLLRTYLSMVDVGFCHLLPYHYVFTLFALLIALLVTEAGLQQPLRFPNDIEGKKLRKDPLTPSLPPLFASHLSH